MPLNVKFYNKCPRIEKIVPLCSTQIGCNPKIIDSDERAQKQ
jgi:hypothetical protein